MTSRITPSRPSRCWGVLGGLVGLWLLWGILSGPGESVADTSRVVADALARDDLNRLKTLATDETKDDMIRFYDAAHPKLEKARREVVEQGRERPGRDRGGGPLEGKGRDRSLLPPRLRPAPHGSAAPPPPTPPPVVPSPGAAPPGAGRVRLRSRRGPLSFHLIWVRSGKHWLLDGRTTSASGRADRPLTLSRGRVHTASSPFRGPPERGSHNPAGSPQGPSIVR